LLQYDDTSRLLPAVEVPWPERPTAFEETMLALAYAPGRTDVDLFSSACVQVYEQHDSSTYDYPLAQVFEQTVLDEVVALSGRSVHAVSTLEDAPSERVGELRERMGAAADLSSVEAANLAAALISISRFGPARQVLDAALERRPDALGRFELAMLQFVVANRCTDGSGSARWFSQMRAAIEQGPIPDGRVLDACTQAVVWYLKRQELPPEDFKWFARMGNDIATNRQSQVPDAALSSWFRGVAMVPAKLRHVANTRAAMENAKLTADRVLSRSGSDYDRHLLKTYYESSVKEHLYVNRDEAKAEEFARLLIELDEVWSVSWGELAEMLVSFGRHREAVAAFDTAARLGPPYVRYHLKSAAGLYEDLGESEEAARRYYALSLFADTPGPLLERCMHLSSEPVLRAHVTERLADSGARR
jgi:tetratricopeptide (TPR) repeat protein